VDVPGLNGVGIDAGEIDFPELLEVGCISAEHVHDFAAFVGDLAEGSDGDAVDHNLRGNGWNGEAEMGKLKTEN
jgi:hypothetical protein